MIFKDTHTLTVTTPEGISFPLLLAGPVIRFLAWFIDWMCILAVMSLVGQAAGILGLISPDFSRAVYALIYFFLSFGYSIALETLWNGQTLGKRLFNLRVTDINGLRLTFSRIAVRNILRAVDALPFAYMIGGASSLLTRHCQRLGDLAAGTVVVRTPVVKQPELEQILSGKFNSFRQYPKLCARIRQKTSLDLAQIVLQALIRRNALDPDARINVFKNLADHFKTLGTFPEETVSGLSDEQYMRNILEILFNDDKKEPETKPTG